MPILLGGDQIDAHGKGQRYVGRMKFMDIIELRAAGLLRHGGAQHGARRRRAAGRVGWRGPEIPVVEDRGRRLPYSDKARIPRRAEPPFCSASFCGIHCRRHHTHLRDVCLCVVVVADVCARPCFRGILPITPLQIWLFTPELQWQSRGKCVYIYP